MIEFNPTDSGIIKCVANNTFGTEEQTFEFFVTGIIFPINLLLPFILSGFILKMLQKDLVLFKRMII